MNKIVIAPDSFKGTLSAFEVCDAMREAVLREMPDAEIVCLPLADGGEGSAKCLCRALGGRMVRLSVCGPLREAVEAEYACVEDTAVIEMASAAGLMLAGKHKSAGQTTTYGVGEMIVHAAHAGLKNVLLCLGGSATNDGGAGMAAACGVRFSDEAGEEFIPVGDSLERISEIDLDALDPAVREMNFTVMTDVQNPLYGEDGAAFVFAPQKGAGPQEVERLDRGLRHFSEKIFQCTGFDVSAIPGGGAAGGMGAGAVAFFNAQTRSGIDTVLDFIGFEKAIEGASLILTGEGRLDGQTAKGKAVSGILKRAGKVPVIAVVGGYEGDTEVFYKAGLRAVFAVNCLPQPLEESAPYAAENVYKTVRNIMRAVGEKI